MRQADILGLMKETGQPLVISGVAVRKWRFGFTDRDPTARRQVGVAPLLSERPSAYKAEVAGQQVSIHAAWAMLRKKIIAPRRRGWRIRARCDVVAAHGDSDPLSGGKT